LSQPQTKRQTKLQLNGPIISFTIQFAESATYIKKDYHHYHRRA